MFFWREQRDGIEVAITDRWGGSSAPPLEEFNLGGHVGDDPGTVQANRGALAQALGVSPDRLLFMNQCHGSSVQVIEGPWTSGVPECDALVTMAADVALGVLVADCVPVLLCDRVAGVIGAVHVGRQGLICGVIDATVDAFAGLGADAVGAVVGPSICGRCYEVPEAMRDEAAAVAPPSADWSWTGPPAIDVAAGVVHQLRRRGVEVTRVPGCSREHPDLYSYRQAQDTGRFAAVIRRYAAADPVGGVGATRAVGDVRAVGAVRVSEAR